MAESLPAENQLSAPLNQQPTLVGGGTVTIKPKFKSDLADEYGVHRNTMLEMCKHIGITSRKKLTIKELMAIYQHYGYPGDYNVSLTIVSG